jgi:hypothetical protein
MYSFFTGPYSGIPSGPIPGALLRFSISNPDVCPKGKRLSEFPPLYASSIALQFYMKTEPRVNETCA